MPDICSASPLGTPQHLPPEIRHAIFNIHFTACRYAELLTPPQEEMGSGMSKGSRNDLRRNDHHNTSILRTSRTIYEEAYEVLRRVYLRKINLLILPSNMNQALMDSTRRIPLICVKAEAEEGSGLDFLINYGPSYRTMTDNFRDIVTGRLDTTRELRVTFECSEGFSIYLWAKRRYHQSGRWLNYAPPSACLNDIVLDLHHLEHVHVCFKNLVELGSHDFGIAGLDVFRLMMVPLARLKTLSKLSFNRELHDLLTDERGQLLLVVKHARASEGSVIAKTDLDGLRWMLHISPK